MDLTRDMNTLNKIFLVVLYSVSWSRAYFIQEGLYGDLNLFSSTIQRGQISLMNASSQVGVVLDPSSGMIFALDGFAQKGMVIDRRQKTGYIIQEAAWANWNGIESVIQDCDVSSLVQRNHHTEFMLDSRHNYRQYKEQSMFMTDMMSRFSQDFSGEIAVRKGNVFVDVIKIFGGIMEIVGGSLELLLDVAMDGWVIFKGGVLVLVKVIEWLGKLVLSVAGGAVRLIENGIRISLFDLITAADGAARFLQVLLAIGSKINLMSVMKSVLYIPAKIAKFIFGLGGTVVQGVTGLFSIIMELFSFNIYKIASTIKSFTQLILNFLRGSQPNPAEVRRSVGGLLVVAEEQYQRYDNKYDYEQYTDFLTSMTGEGKYAIHGIPIGPIVRVLTHPAQSAKSVVVSILKMINPLIPFKLALPHFLVNVVKSLNDSSESSYVEQLIPGITLPKEGEGLRSLLPTDSDEQMRSLPAPLLLRKMPVVSEIFKEFDDIAQSYANTTLDDMLENHHLEEMLEFTNSAFGLY